MDYKEAIILLIIVKKAFLGSTEGDSYQEVAHKKIVEAIDLAIEALDNEPKKCEEITEEKAIDFLRHTGWLYEHDKVLTTPFGGIERQQGECKSCSHRDPEDKKCDCGALERVGCQFPVSDDYYCKYYERRTWDAEEVDNEQS